MRTLFSLLILAVFGLVLPVAHAGGATGTLVVQNARPDQVTTLVDGLPLGPVPAQSDRAFRLHVGSHDVMIQDRAGQVVERTRLVLKPGQVTTIALAPPKGSLEIRNGSGTTLSLVVDGNQLGELPVGATRSVGVVAGSHQITATYRQLGRDRVLSNLNLSVAPGEREQIALQPVSSGLVRVENHTGRPGDVVADGRLVASLDDGQSAEIVTRLGRVELVLSSHGRALATTSLAVGAYDNLVWRAVAPATGDLLVQNPLPMPVYVTTDNGRSTTVKPYGAATIHAVQVGRTTLTAHRTSGEPLARGTVEVRPYDVARWTVPAPATGLVQIRNDDARALEVWMDGARLSFVNPRGQVTLEVKVGTHRVQLRDTAGRMLLDTRVEVDGFETAQVRWSQGPVATTGHSGSAHHGSSAHTRP